MRSQTVSFYTITSAIQRASIEMRREEPLIPVNDYQERFLNEYYYSNALVQLPEILSYMSCNASDLNAILEKEGFDIRLDPFPDFSLGVVGILSLVLSWISKGEKVTIVGDNDTLYQGIRIAENIVFYRSPLHMHPVVLITTKNGDQVGMTIAEKPCIRFGLMNRVREITRSMIPIGIEYEVVKFPILTYDQIVDISWLQKLHFFAHGHDWFIAQALQQTKLDVDETGVRIKDAVALEFRCAMGVAAMSTYPQDMIIDKPLLLWVMRPSLAMPVFAGYMDYDCWKTEG